jgi:hypothetical protein
MSAQPTAPEATETAAEVTEPQEPEATKPTETVEFWKSKSREQEKRAKENAEAAKRLTEIEESQKSEAQKAADALAQAEARIKVAESKALSLSIATDHKLGAEDAALLAALPDEDSMRALAERLAGKPTTPKPDLSQGGKSTPPAGEDEVREFARNLFNRGG